MAKYYRSEDEAPIVESPVADEEGQVIAATATTEPDLPPAGPVEPIAEVESTREPEADPTVPEQRFRQEGEEVEAAPEAAPAEAPAAPMDAPAEVPAADAAPAEAPMAPEAAPAPEGVPAAPADAPVADVPAAAPMVPPQPETEVAPMAPEAAPEAAPVAPEVEAPTAPAEEPVEDAPVQHFRQEEGEEISVVATEDPRMPADTESETCPESGDECVTKDIKEPINPVIEQEDEITADPSEDEALKEGEEAGGTEPAEVETHNDITAIEPEAAEDQEAAENEVEEATMRFSQAFHMEDDATEIPVDSDNGDQDVNVQVEVRKDDGDAHEDAPVQRFGFRQEGEEAPEVVETVSDVTKVDTEQPAEDDIADAVVPDPIDPDAGNPDPDQCFSSMFNMGGEWM